MFLLLAGFNSAVGGNISYPALNHFPIQEGTVEVWFSPTVELYPENPGRYTGAFALWSIEVEGEFRVGAGWGSTSGGTDYSDNQHRLHYSISGKIPRQLLPVSSQPKGWGIGEPRHVAFTWKDNQMLSYVDGEQTGGRNQAGTFTGLTGDADFILGNRHARDSHIIVHAVRLSSKARTSEDLENAQPVADIHTLLLDNFTLSENFREGRTSPEVMTLYPGQADGGVAAGDVTFVESPYPGLQL